VNPNAQPIIVFDGVCNLCARSVGFIIQRDPHKQFRFAAFQSATGEQLARTPGFPAHMESLVLIEGGNCYTKSDAALRIARQLSGGWRGLGWGRIFPRFLRDAIYDLIARRRYRWFGRMDQCLVPSPDILDRFI